MGLQRAFSTVKDPLVTSNAPIPVILDVDTGYDDALALLLALRTPRLDVQGITCVAGNQRLEQVVANTLKILDVAKAPPIPVAAGMDRPLLEAMRAPFLLHGQDGMADLGLPPSPRRPADIHAVAWLRQYLDGATTPVTLIALAPLTNLAVFLRMYPQLEDKIERIVVMGGTLASPGNTSPMAEFNVRHDPEAAAMVLQSGLPIRLYPLDVFRHIAFTREEVEGFRASTDPVAQTAGRILGYVCRFLDQDQALVGDAGAVATVIDPAGASWASYPISVELTGNVTRGQTVLDRRPLAQQESMKHWWQTATTQVEVIEDVDVARYRRLIATAYGA